MKFYKNINQVTAYLTTLYFVEIIYIMFVLFIFVNKYIAIITGLILAVLLTMHILLLYYKNNLSRKIHLFLIDIHAAYTISYLINLFFQNINLQIATVILIIVRFFILLIELPLIYFLTNEKIIKSFK